LKAYWLQIRSLELKRWREGETVKAYPLQVDIAPPPLGPFEVRLFNDANVRVAFSPDGVRLALVHARRLVKIWDTVTGKELALLPQQGKDIHCLVFSPDGTRLATVAQTMDTGPVMPDIDLGPDVAMHRTVSPVTEAQRAPEVKLWDLGTSRAVLAFRPHLELVESVAFSLDGRRLATGSRDGTIKMREVPRAAPPSE
jgi:WD40 repeat protein